MSELREIAERVMATKGRAWGGVGGQTIEATARSTFHEISAWDGDRLFDIAGEVAALEAERDALRQELDGVLKMIGDTKGRQ